MSAVDPRVFAARVSAECLASAEGLLALQATIGAELDGAAITPRLLADMQTLDAVYQTLADLGHVFSRLSNADKAACGPSGIPMAALIDARQTTLRKRLAGEREVEPGETVDLF